MEGVLTIRELSAPMSALSISSDGGNAWEDVNRTLGKLLMTLNGSPVFLAIASGGVCALQADNSIVASSEKLPCGKTSRNYVPSGPRSWIERVAVLSISVLR